MAFPRIACCALVALLCSLFASAAQAAPVLVMDKDGHVRSHAHSLAPASTFPAPRRAATAARPRAGVAASRRAKAVPEALAALRDAGAIDDTAYAGRLAAYDDAMKTVKRLSGTRKRELAAVV